jgi:hypothetical protein
MLAKSNGHFSIQNTWIYLFIPQFLSWYLVATNVFVFNFVMLFKWRSSISIFSQIWQYEQNMKVENLKHPFISRQVWQFLVV